MKTEQELLEMKLIDIKKYLQSLGGKVGSMRTKPVLIERILKLQEESAAAADVVGKTEADEDTQEVTTVSVTTEDVQEETPAVTQEQVVVESKPEVKPVAEEDTHVEPSDEALQENRELTQGEIDFGNLQNLKDTIKDMPNEDLFEVAQSYGCTWTQHENKRYERMRCCMALYDKLFPTAKKTSPKPKVSPWKEYTNEQLDQICADNSITYTHTKNDATTRMWMINALKKSGITPESLQ